MDIHKYQNLSVINDGAALYLFCGEGSRLSSRMCPALGGCRLTGLSEEESSGPKSCAGFFYKKKKIYIKRKTLNYCSKYCIVISVILS